MQNNKHWNLEQGLYIVHCTMQFYMYMGKPGKNSGDELKRFKGNPLKGGLKKKKKKGKKLFSKKKNN